MLGIILLPFGLAIALAILVIDGRPIFYNSERMCDPNQSFQLIKFRTMQSSNDNSGVSGGDKAARVTICGAFLRRTRLDELPQLINVLWGEISFVGPRPPLRQYVEKFPDLYADVLKTRPGITGLATVLYHEQEEQLLAKCTSAAETDQVYSEICVPKKAAFDLLYQQNRSMLFDCQIMLMTVFRSLR